MSEQTLKAICGQFRGRLRRLLLEYGILQMVFLSLAVAGLLVLGDWYVRFSPDLRLASLLTVLAVTGLSGYFGLYRPLKRVWTDDEVLGYMDRTAEEGGDVMTTLRDLSHPEKMKEYQSEQGKSIVKSIVGELEQRVNKADIGKVLRLQPINLWRKVAGVLLVLYVVALLFPRDSVSGSSYFVIGLKRLVLPYASIFWPQKTRLYVQNPDSGWRVPRGEPLVVKVKIEGEVPPIVNIVYQGSGTEPITERMAVNVVGQEAVFTFGEMTEPMTFFCTGGDDFERRRYSVTIAERPVIVGVKAEYSYPLYMRLKNRTLKTGQLSGPEGAEVKLEFTASTKLAKAVMKFTLDGEDAQKPIEITDFSGTVFKHQTRLSKNGNYLIELTDTQNLKNGKVEKFEIRVEPDNPPEVTLEEPMRDLLMTANGKIRVKFKAKDDYNLVELNAMLGPAGGTGKALSDKITGEFWNMSSTLHPDGAGDFDLDFPKEKEKKTLKDLVLDNGAELELWVRAMDCNPSSNGVTESMKVRLSILTETDFMDAVVLKAKELMNDARFGWYASAGVYHDANAWVKNTADDKLFDKINDQQLTLESSTEALKLHYGEIVQHMQRNRMQQVFMSKRLDKAGAFINDIGALVPLIAKKVADGRPKSSQEEEPAAKRAKMAKALQGAMPDHNKAAWQMRLLYDRLADWVSLQSVLLKTRRIEETQTKVNAQTEQFVKKTLGREARELEDKETRTMREIGSQQQTVYDMEEAVEKALAELIQQADKDKRKKVLDVLVSAFSSLRDNRVRDKLKQAALNILDARGDLVRNDQRMVLEVVAGVNRALVLAGEQVPDDPPASAFAAVVEDPRGKETAVAKSDDDKGGDVIDESIYKPTGKSVVLAGVAEDSLEGTLDKIYRNQEDVRNRTMHVADRGKLAPRYAFLRTGLMTQRQGNITNLLAKALGQVKDYGKPPASDPSKKDEAKVEPDPTIDAAKARIVGQVSDYLDGAVDAAQLIQEGEFGPFVTALQTHIQKGSQDVRVFMQESGRKHKLFVDRKATNFEDAFERKYLLREKNLTSVVDASKELEWALSLEANAQREAELLAAASQQKLSPRGKAAMERIEKSARKKAEEIAVIIAKIQTGVTSGVTDPSDPELENEKVKARIQDKMLGPLDPKEFTSIVGQFDKKDYQGAAIKQESMRRSISTVLLALADLFDDRVKPKEAVAIAFDPTSTNTAGGDWEYEDEKPPVVADKIEKEGDWLDQVTGDPEVRKALVAKLRGMQEFDPRYKRLQSAYFQAMALDFQAKAKDKKKKKDDDKKKPPDDKKKPADKK
ncbi:MAG: hypothetical protein C0404_11585 [Verrucomicrobia bacterium]|nr:hypothetical protein [Verrucomicrobiota bacterium]